MTEEKEEDFIINKNCRFFENNIESDEVRDHCHRRGKYSRPAHSKGNINVTQKQSNFLPYVFHNFSNYDCHLFFRRFVDKRMINFSLAYGYIRFIDS